VPPAMKHVPTLLLTLDKRMSKMSTRSQFSSVASHGLSRSGVAPPL
jgi:hypothetical protein